MEFFPPRAGRTSVEFINFDLWQSEAKRHLVVPPDIQFHRIPYYILLILRAVETEWKKIMCE